MGNLAFKERSGMVRLDGQAATHMKEIYSYNILQRYVLLWNQKQGQMVECSRMC